MLIAPPATLSILNALTDAVASSCQTPVALLSLIDADNQTVESATGLAISKQIASSASLCANSVHHDGILIIEDASQDATHRECQLVRDNGLRFYAGVAFSLEDSGEIATLCVMDYVPGRLTDVQQQAMLSIAQAARVALQDSVRGSLTRGDADRDENIPRRFIRKSTAMLQTIDSTGKLLEVSDAWLKKFGYTRTEIIGRAWPDFMTAESAKYAREVTFPKFFRDGYFHNIEYQVLTKRRELLDISVSAMLQPNVEGHLPSSLAILQDITAGRQAERRLAEDRDRLNSIIDGTNAGAWEWNVQTGEMHSNDRWRELLGYTVKEMPNITLNISESLMHPDDLERSKQLFLAHFVGETDHYECEVRMRHKLGHWLWMLDRGSVSVRDENGRVLWVSGTQIDITDRKTAELALIETKHLLERTAVIANVGGFEIDLRSSLCRLSMQAYRIFEIESGKLISIDRLIEFLAGEGRAEAYDVLENCIKHGKSFSHEWPATTASGREIWIQVGGNVEYDGETVVRIVGTIQDITQKYLAEQKLAESRELLEVTLESIDSAVITTTKNGDIRWMNPVAKQLTGWTRDSERRALGDVYTSRSDSSPGTSEISAVKECLATGESVVRHDVSFVVARTGKSISVEESASPIRDQNAKIIGTVFVVRDVSEHQRLTQEVRYRASHDALTGLLNRVEFESRLQDVLELAALDGSAHALMYIDLDEFKIVNDSCGHAAGDILLKNISKIFKRCVRRSDILARLGGDEFGVILENCSLDQALQIAQKICDSVSDYRFTHDKRPYRVGSSIGLVPIDAMSQSVASVLKAADASCYAAKERGRNRVQLWAATDQTISTRRGEMRWTQRIEQSLDEDCFELYGQKIAPLDSTTCGIHCELLLRMRGADNATIPPGAFLPAAERYHLAQRIDRWVVQRALKWCAKLGSDLHAFDSIAINLSGQSLADESFHEFVEDQLQKSSIDKSKLCFEITETAAITNFVEASNFVERIRHYGARTALDDFGAGASSFGYLKSLPVDLLKIDGQYIRNLNDDELDLATVKCFVEIAGVIGIKTEAVVKTLREIGVDYAQGYYFHRPAPIDTIVRQAMAQVG